MFATKAEFEETLFQLASVVFMLSFFYVYIQMCMPKTPEQRARDHDEWQRTLRIRRRTKNTNVNTMVPW
jgi:hypothetical protein